MRKSQVAAPTTMVELVGFRSRPPRGARHPRLSFSPRVRASRKCIKVHDSDTSVTRDARRRRRMGLRLRDVSTWSAPWEIVNKSSHLP